ncbi:unnamed protein product [Rotaria sp. Silwood2]|nr:unnamed protein product [Rotaria sp. Silwood2]CAF4257975.1 unnamed protein product [Rotaria sp. Silwood2]
MSLLYNQIELEAEYNNAEFYLDRKYLYIYIHRNIKKMVDAEWPILYDKLEKLHKTDVNVILSKLPFDDVVTQYFANW